MRTAERAVIDGCALAADESSDSFFHSRCIRGSGSGDKENETKQRYKYFRMIHFLFLRFIKENNTTTVEPTADGKIEEAIQDAGAPVKIFAVRRI